MKFKNPDLTRQFAVLNLDSNKICDLSFRYPDEFPFDLTYWARFAAPRGLLPSKREEQKLLIFLEWYQLVLDRADELLVLDDWGTIDIDSIVIAAISEIEQWENQVYLDFFNRILPKTYGQELLEFICRGKHDLRQ